MFAYTAMCGDWDRFVERDCPSIYDAKSAKRQTWWCFWVCVCFPFISAIAALLDGDWKAGFRWSVRPSSKFGGPNR